MMRQFNEIKAQAKDCILFFRLGDFYEMFGDDALEASEILGIALTARNKGDNAVAMCGVPHHAASGYIAKLTRAGKKVAICEQLSDPSLTGIVKREIVRIITPGTTLDENILDDKTSNYLLAVFPDDNDELFGLALVEISTGEFTVFSAKDLNELITVCGKYRPREIIYPNISENQRIIEFLKKYYPGAFYFSESPPLENNASTNSSMTFPDDIGENSKNRDSKETVATFVEKMATDLALNYLKNTQKISLTGSSLAYLKTSQTRKETFLTLDESTIRNLELIENLQDKKINGSLLSILDKTVTSTGARLLKRMIVEPLSDLKSIENRLETIDILMERQNLLLDLRSILKNLFDLERIIGRLSLLAGNARDMKNLATSLYTLEVLSDAIDKNCPLLKEKNPYNIRLLPELRKELEKAIVEEPPLSIKDGGMIRDGYNEELDKFRQLSREGKNVIQAMQAREITRTGINSLKVRYNKVFGYYIEVSNANLSQVPEDYTRKQTLANAERFSTPELKKYEEKVLTAEEKIPEIESKLFGNLREMILDKAAYIKESALASAYLDVILSFALTGWENNYVRPRITNGYDLKIIGGRHPVIEKLNSQDKFVPNDGILTEQNNLALITGPNMGGKSTYLRQIALIVLMAHLGMYVPASSAEIPLVDRIFTRVGASDNLVKGQSTFWLEMEETAMILKYATSKSLVILDEIGRGTSTFDGVSIAWGVMEFIHNEIKAKTLFASHYHELIVLAEDLPHAKNLSVQVKESANEIVFLYVVGEGGVNRSYGIEVARRAGLPNNVIKRAREILRNLEKESVDTNSNTFCCENSTFDSTDNYHSKSFSDNSSNLTEREHKGISEINSLNTDLMTPIEALNKLIEIKKIIEQDE